MIATLLILVSIGGGGPSDLPECPVEGAVEYSQSFGIRHHRGGHRHGGIDIYAERGTPVVAPEDGIVLLDENKRGGLTAYLLAGDTTYYFAHLDSQGVDGSVLDMGDAWKVEAGTTVGTVGNTGNAKRTKPHLHFEKRVDGKRVNPYDLLEASCLRV